MLQIWFKLQDNMTKICMQKLRNENDCKKTQCATYCNVESSRKTNKQTMKASDKAKIWTLTWIEDKIGRKWWEGKKNNGDIKKIPLNPKIPKLALKN